MTQSMASVPSSKTLKSTLLIAALLLLKFCIINAHGGDDHGDSDGEDLHEKGLVSVKIWCLIILLVSTFAGGVSPYFYRWNESFLLFGTQFAGGVFLGTSLLHFLSDANETFEDLSTKPYPFAFMLASVGYLLTMLGDCIVILVTKGGEKEAKVEAAEEGVNETPVDLNPPFPRTSSFGDTILLILALCFHSVFEGIAIGVSGKTLKNTTYCHRVLPCNLSFCIEIWSF